MASSPNSQPDGPPPPETDTPPSLLPPILSPPSPDTTTPAPPDSQLPPTSSAPPPPTSDPPPSPPISPPPSPNVSPPPSANVSPPPSPPDASPPTPSSVLTPPQASSPPSQSPPTSVASPPPPKSRTPTPPLSPDSPESPPTPALPPSAPDFTPPSPVDSSSPPSSTPSPPAPPTNSSTTPIVPSPKTPSTPGSPTTTTTIKTPSASDNSSQGVTTGIAIGVVAAVVIIGFIAILCMRRKKKHNRYDTVYKLPSPHNSSQQVSGSSFINPTSSGGGVSDFMSSSHDTSGFGSSQAWFSYEQLTTATNGFNSQNILGTGGFGCVYKGLLQDGREVAIKKLKNGSAQGDREFKAEIEVISRVHHRYLVSLVGYCLTDNQRLLVFEFVSNGTLDHHLHSSSKPPMEWSLRVKVACGSARGIAYLHEDCHPKIIHRDIKTANILVDNNFEAKVADFGLAKLGQELELNTHISTRVMGTFGYMAPEYASSGKLTEKSDVFSFGVVLLEIITGRKPVDQTRPLGDESLVEWARPLMTEALDNENFDELADPRLQGNYDKGEMFRMIEAAAACVRHSAAKRPKMSQVVRALDTMSELTDLSNGMRPGQSGIYDTREQSAQMKMFQRMAFGTQEFSSEYQSNSHGAWTNGDRSGQV